MTVTAQDVDVAVSNTSVAHRGVQVARFLGKRLLMLAVTLFAASFVVYIALFIAHPDPMPFLTRGRTVSPEAEEILRAQYHLDEPVLARYWLWLGNVVQGDLGSSIITKEPIGTSIRNSAGTTFILLAYSTVLIVAGGVSAGIASVVGAKPVAAISRISLKLGLAIPSFIVGPALIAVFAVGLHWFPVFGPGEGLVDRIYHSTLPAVALSLMAAAYVGRITAASIAEEVAREHVATARVRGLPSRWILRRHILRNAAIPIVSASSLTIASLLGASVVVESIFGLQGLGSLLLRGVNEGDVPVVQGVTLLFVALFVTLNLVLDVVYALLDPRVVVS